MSFCDEHILGISLRIITDEITKFCMYYLNYSSFFFMRIQGVNGSYFFFSS